MAASLGALVFVVMEAYRLGADDGAPPPVLGSDDPYRTEHTPESGRTAGTVYSGQDLTVYDRVDGAEERGPARAADAPERPAPEDYAATRARLTGQETLNIIAEAYDLDPDKIRRRIVDLETLVTEPGEVETLADEDAAFAPIPIAPTGPAGDAVEQVAQVEIGAAEIEPAEIKTAENQRAETQPAEIEPTEIEPAQIKPAETTAGPAADKRPGRAEAGDADPPPPPAETVETVETVDAPAPAREPAENAAAPLRQAAVRSSRFEAQLAALESRSAVDAAWARLSAQHADLLGRYRMRVEPTTVQDQRLYRLRITPFQDRSAAAELCKSLEERGVECFVATGG